MTAVAFLALAAAGLQEGYEVRKGHPRLLIDDLPAVVGRVKGPLAEDYDHVKRRADAASRKGPAELRTNGWGHPINLLNCGLAFLVERERGGDGKKYVDVIRRHWDGGALIPNRTSRERCQFGYHALAYDWIYDALTPGERRRYGNTLGTWLRYYTGKPEILLKYGYWEYNQTWGPSHLNIAHSRDALVQKLFISVAILGAGTKYEADARTFLDSWHRRIPAECLPAFDRMGGVWSESMGHGGYGPVTVIPYAFHAWRTATGIDYFKQLKPWGYPVESPRWVAYTMMPHNRKTAWIDDNRAGYPTAFVRAAPMLRDGLSQWFSIHGRPWVDARDWRKERWQRVACFDPSLEPRAPDTLPLGYLFGGAGHAYMRSAWVDPNATWAFFGCGPQFAGHARDDEGHFLISRKGAIVSRQGGQGHNDDDDYSGGSLIFNIVTIFDPDEKFRRTRRNENDGGLLRHVYERGKRPRERGRMVAFEHTTEYTYAAADVTRGYHAGKAKEVTRQLLYLRGDREFFVIFDRVTATKPEFKRHFFLHVPTEPGGAGRRRTWLSLPEADGDREVLSTGKSRAFLRTLLPEGARVTVRGGPGKEAWGHPLEPTAQYNHETRGRKRPPICPWRIEVADPSDGDRTLYLHVLEVVDEEVRTPTDLRFVAPAGVDIGERWNIRFRSEGPLGGSVGSRPLAETLRIQGQYK